MPFRRLSLLASLAALLLAAGLSVSAADVSAVGDGSAALEWISRSSDGSQPLQESRNRDAAVSQNGRYAVFTTDAVNWPGAGKSSENVYRKDLQTGELRLISRTPAGVAADRPSSDPDISGDGKFVVFSSFAHNLLPNVDHGVEVFLHTVASGAIELISQSDAGAPSLNWNSQPAIDPSGRYVAWTSGASLAPGDTNGFLDVYLRDRQLGVTRRVSVTSGGGSANDHCSEPAISNDGRYVAFTSQATNLVPNDTNNFPDVFLRDLVNNTTTRISLGTGGAELNYGAYSFALSGDGKRVAFVSYSTNALPTQPPGYSFAYFRDLQTGEIAPASISAGGEMVQAVTSVSLNDTGTLIAFDSQMEGVVPGDENAASDCYLRDLTVGTTTYLSRSPAPATGRAESSAPLLSGNGTRVVFTSRNAAFVPGSNRGVNLYGALVSGGPFQLVSATFAGVTGDAHGESSDPEISANGRYVAFTSRARNLVPGDTNGETDVFVHDRATGVLTRESLTPAGEEFALGGSQPTISGDGRYLAWCGVLRDGTEESSWTQRIFLRDRTTGVVRDFVRARDGKLPNNSSGEPSIDSAGTRIVFSSYATNLTAGESQNFDQDIYWRSIANATTGLITTSTSGGSSNGYSSSPQISADGRLAVFESIATNLVPGDTNGKQDVFIRDIAAGSTTRVNVATNGAQANDESWYPSIGTTGIVFQSYASNLVPNDTNGQPDIFIRYPTARTERLTVTTAGAQVQTGGIEPAINAADDTVAFTSGSWEFNPDDDGSGRIFVRDLQRRATVSASLPTGSGMPYASDRGADLESSGRYLAFVSERPQSALGDLHDNADIFVRDRWNFPPAPVLASVTPGPKPRSLRVTWEYRTETETGFTVERKIGSGPWTFLKTTDAATHTLDDENLEYNTVHSYRVRVFNAHYTSPFSQEVSAASELEPPSDFTASVYQDGKGINLEWKTVHSAFDGFQLWRKVGNGEFEFRATIHRNLRGFFDQGLQPETLYTYRLTSFDDGEESRPAVVSAKTPKDPPPPMGLEASASGREISLQWYIVGSPTIDGTHIERRKGSGAFSRIDTVPADQFFYTDRGLEADIEYGYRLTHFRGNLLSDPSETVTARTAAPPPAPTGLTAIYKKGVALRWNPVPNEELVMIKVFRKQDQGKFAFLYEVPGRESTTVDTKVQPGHSYTYRIAASDSVGDSPFSNEASLTIPNQPPMADAGPDRTVKTRGKKAKVHLDGSASSDPEGKTLTFTWTENKTQIATGAAPSVKLRPGTHTLTLIVRDPDKATATDQVTINVKRKR